MLRLPQKQTLEKQTVAILREQIATGAWSGWLPGERVLCDHLQVSRYTLRAALRQLRAEGAITSEQGTGNRIVGQTAGPSETRRSAVEVGLLIAGELGVLLPTQIMWIDLLRGMLADRGCRLHLFHGRQFAQRDPSRALRQLVTRHAHRCWILLLSSQPVQRWFQENHLSCVVAGSLHPGISIPCCDIDHRAMCRHAAGVLLGRGHRMLALIVQKSQHAGDAESEAGFIEAVRQAGADAAMGYHDATPAGIAAAVRRLMLRAPTPTAMLVVNAFHTLTVMSTLTRLGRRVPEDVSVISRDGEPFLSYMTPAPAHYTVDPKAFAKTLLGQVLEVLKDNAVTRRVSLIMPEFYRGQSILGSR